MNITLSPPSAGRLPALRQLYLDSFPPEERRPWEEIADPSRLPRLLAIVLSDGSTAGFVTIWPFAAFTYIEHLATDPGLRGRGIGAQVMAALSTAHAPLLLEVERPAGLGSIEARRIGFYRRCGLHLLDHDYIQPPYAPGLPSVPLLLMSTDPALDAPAAAATLHREVYGV